MTEFFICKPKVAGSSPCSVENSILRNGTKWKNPVWRRVHQWKLPIFMEDSILEDGTTMESYSPHDGIFFHSRYCLICYIRSGEWNGHPNFLTKFSEWLKYYPCSIFGKFHSDRLSTFIEILIFARRNSRKFAKRRKCYT